ncbi:MAG: ABC transporter permease [Microbacteriaceae bacterium]
MRLAGRIGARFASVVLVFLGVTFLIYFMVWSLPGDPIRALGGDRPLSDAAVATLRERFNLDLPLWQQYTLYLGGLFQGDFGVDFNNRPVAPQMASRWPVTITLALTAWVLQIIVGVALGVIAALRNGTAIDKGILAVTIAIGAIPVFVVGVSAQLIFGIRLDLLPVAGTADGWPRSFILPAAVIAIFGLTAISRLVRTSMLENLNADFVTLGRAKGLSEQRIVGVHVMRNSLIPTVTYLGTDLGYLLGGTVIIEGIFNLHGVGNLLFEAIRTHEGPTVVGVSTALIIIFIVTSLIVDAVHALLDPRVRR